MKLFYRCFYYVSALILMAVVNLVHAGAQPSFSLIPNRSPTIDIATNDSATIKYQVTNQSKLVRIVKMVTIRAVTQEISGADACSDPFILMPKQSCVLTLRIRGDQLSTDGIHSGPVVCITLNSGTNTPDPFLCSQPSQDHSFNIKRVDA